VPLLRAFRGDGRANGPYRPGIQHVTRLNPAASCRENTELHLALQHLGAIRDRRRETKDGSRQIDEGQPGHCSREVIVPEPVCHPVPFGRPLEAVKKEGGEAVSTNPFAPAIPPGKEAAPPKK